MSEFNITNNTYKYLKLIYKHYIKMLKLNSPQPDVFNNIYFNEASKKFNSFTINKARASLIKHGFINPYTDGGFRLNDEGINYVETHKITYLIEIWLRQNIVSLMALLISFLSYILSIISLLVGLK